MAEYPYTNKPEDIPRLLKKLPTIAVPTERVDAEYIKSLGFSPASSKHLSDILKTLGFVGDNEEPTIIWKNYVTDERRDIILASVVKKTYSNLFEVSFCPYLEGDDTIVDFFKQEVKASGKDILLMLDTFRNLSELADFQETMCEETPSVVEPAREFDMPDVKVNPNLQLNIQIHIDPNTPDEKIEAIFKNLRKYLMEKPAP